MNIFLPRGLRALWLLVVVCCTVYLAMHGLRHTRWHKERLYRQLVAGDARQQFRAACALAALGAEEQLLAALKADDAAARDLARRGVEHLWFTAAGDEAYQLMQSAQQAEAKENFPEALAVLHRLLAKFPTYAEGWNRRASVYWQMGDYEKSIADCERTLRLNPNHYGAWQGTGICRLKLGDLAAACDCLRAALKIAPHDEATRDALRRCEELRRQFTPPGTKPDKVEMI